MSLKDMFQSVVNSVKSVFSTKPIEVHIEEVAVTPIAEKPAKVVKTVDGVKPAVAAKKPRKPRTPKTPVAK